MLIFDRAIKFLKEGKVIAAPTETVYGLFGDATSDIAVQEIYKVKGRPSCNPLILHVSSIEMTAKYAEISEKNYNLLDLFWNSLKLPITFILPLKKNSEISSFVTAGLNTVALRKPNHAIPYYLIDTFGRPLAAPSANTSTMLSPTSYNMVLEDIGDKVSLIIDGGMCEFGIESTILDITCEPYELLRAGGTTVQDIERHTNTQIVINKNEACVKAPGMMKKHYAPRIPLRMNASYPLEGEAFIAFGKTDIKYDYNLSESGDLSEASRNFFVSLKKFDDNSKYTGIAVMPIPQTGLGMAINDRLKRASYTRQKVLLIIIDGFGISEETLGNAAIEAKYIQNLVKKYPSSELFASGEYVGLPSGQFGNSEVGHLTIGAGRVVKQKLPMITESIEDHSFEKNSALLKFLKNTKRCHIMGLFSKGGVHSHLHHFMHAIEILREHNIDIKAHLFLDGRDVAYNDALVTIKDSGILNQEIATIQGRYYAMDRDKKWERTNIAYNAIVNANAQYTNVIDPLKKIEEFYNTGIYDENISPFIMEGYKGALEDDSFWMINFRTDRIVQLLSLLKNKKLLNMVNIDPEIDSRYLTMFPQTDIKNSLGEIVSNNNLRQLRLAETEKYAHVTYFMNGGVSDIPFRNEDRILIPSPKVSDYVTTPDMSSAEITETLINNFDKEYDLIIVNYASPDMIGHTGDLEATKKSIKMLDEHIKKIVEVAVLKEYAIIITSDHGNAETMIVNGEICKTHTSSKVPFVYVSKKADITSSISIESGSLQDIAPTILAILGLDQPADMTGKSLI